ncbi:MAG TPA: RNA-binding protein [Levilinea sp.]|nr:RNA-binding protein [Levilinea sp.]
MNIYVGNLSYQTTEDDIRQAFAAHGEVTSASIIKDKFSGESRGFAFVEMPNSAEARQAIQVMNGADLGGRALKVNEARPREEGGGRRGGGGGGGGGYGGGGGGGGGGGRRQGGGGGERRGDRRSSGGGNRSW